ncbi:HNH endonuclease signature motif containing protein [Glaciibacter superstes]|uniref:HNH endonuclease signature motif containing protein n=1 Tax=Glaciibacter superstes TaxID=501023 RepID=UPI0003B6F280|nr:HNH endonuclease signature motif containing protein [Glaciibacter superstes]
MDEDDLEVQGPWGCHPEWGDAPPDVGDLDDLVSLAYRRDVLPDGYADRLRVFVDDVVEDWSEAAIRAAGMARKIDRARVWSETSDVFVDSNAPLTDSERAAWNVRVFASELAVQLTLSETATAKRIAESRVLVHELPRTLEALELGLISYSHAQVIIDQAGTLPEEARAEFEDAVLDVAYRVPVARFRHAAVKARERLHPDSIKERAKKAAAERRFVLEPDLDGMAWLHQYLPVTDAQAIYRRVTGIATSMQHPGEARTLTQLRSDVAAALLMDGIPESELKDGAYRQSGRKHKDGKTGGKNGGGKRQAGVPDWGIRPTVFVTVPVFTLMGQSDEPGQLEGYGPIDPDTARGLAAKAPWFTRILTHPETGIVLSFGKDRYRPPKDLRDWLTLRDGTCRYPGCGRPASETDIDHTRDAQFGGPTDESNLSNLCRPHHLLKHLTAWKLTQKPGSILEWTSPLGATAITTPAIEPMKAVLPDNPPF